MYAVDGFGYCWRPYGVSAGWNPFQFGNWFFDPRLAIGYSSEANRGAGCLITTETGFFILASDGYGRRRDHSRTRERGISAARRRRPGDR